MPYSEWSETKDGNLMLKMPGSVYYKFSKDELNTLWSATVQEAEGAVKQSAQSLPSGSLLEVNTDQGRFLVLMATWIDVGLKKEKIGYNDAQKEIATDKVNPFSYFSPGK